ncbi:hypothetical protein [Streptomyces sp. NRRL B-24484]|uniref:hypothetical protein n=1 Tax=Streptomyces sp. NRRL B-24484 TaxID=1463833 RepID=UPI0004C1F4F3|nr:hypothetical protein [Streptomyces sp. NRRL B-24484]
MAFPHHPHRVPEDKPGTPRHDRAVLGALGALIDDLAALGTGHTRPEDPDAGEPAEAPRPRERRASVRPAPRADDLTATA